MSENRPERNMPHAPAPPRTYQFSVRVGPEMLRKAGIHYMWRRLRLRYLAGWAGVGLGAMAWSTSDLGLLTDMLGVVTVALALVLVLLPLAIWRAIGRTLEGYGKLTEWAPVQYTVDDEWLLSQYANGSGELRWSAFREILKLEEVWLLVMAGEERFIPLPVEQAPEDALLFIEAEVAAHGQR